ncbi:hypothetical protein I552_9772 [Mycobacterium xenopi 3993]|nr:hypothetical protein I552_9772 [Mycobacterium xenopi 3993]
MATSSCGRPRPGAARCRQRRRDLDGWRRLSRRRRRGPLGQVRRRHRSSGQLRRRPRPRRRFSRRRRGGPWAVLGWRCGLRWRDPDRLRRRLGRRLAARSTGHPLRRRSRPHRAAACRTAQAGAPACLRGGCGGGGVRGAGWPGLAGVLAAWAGGPGRLPRRQAEQQPRPVLRITDRDGLAVANVDYRHPHAVDVDAVSALVDCHPLFAGEPQYEVHRRDPPATTVVEAEIRPAVVTDRDVAAGRNVWLVDPTHTVNGEANASVRMGRHLSSPVGADRWLSTRRHDYLSNSAAQPGASVPLPGSRGLRRRRGVVEKPAQHRHGLGQYPPIRGSRRASCGSIADARSARTRLRARTPAGVMRIRTARASRGSTVRLTRPASSSRRTCVVIVGCEQWSMAARSQMRASPWASMVASSRACATGKGSWMRWVASRLSRATTARSSAPSLESASVLAPLPSAAPLAVPEVDIPHDCIALLCRTIVMLIAARPLWHVRHRRCLAESVQWSRPSGVPRPKRGLVHCGPPNWRRPR